MRSKPNQRMDAAVWLSQISQETARPFCFELGTSGIEPRDLPCGFFG